MLCKPKLSAVRQKVRRVFYTVIIVLVILSAFLEFAVKSQLTDVITVQMKTVAQRAVNAAVTEFLSSNAEIGEKLTAVQYGDSGDVSAIISDPSAVNYLKASVSELSQDKIEALAEGEGITVPVGSFSGFFLLANFGPDIPLSISSRQTITCSLKSTFESAGVNQTIHHIILNVDIEMVVYNPFRFRRPIHTCADFEIAQTVIVGAVPSYVPTALWQ